VVAHLQARAVDAHIASEGVLNLPPLAGVPLAIKASREMHLLQIVMPCLHAWLTHMHAGQPVHKGVAHHSWVSNIERLRASL
jgi:hypothetical protein